MTFFREPPRPPELSAGQIRALIDYSEKMAAYMDHEISDANETGLGHAALHLPAIADGWRFTAQAISETYDGEF